MSSKVLAARLAEALAKARKRFNGIVSRDPLDIQVRELPNGVCEVVCFPDSRQATRLVGKGLQRGADGVVVVASAPDWPSLLGS